MDLEERRKRHALNYGLYNFQDVKKYFFTKEGWRATSGPALSYDHYYIKPGKNPKNPNHKQGVDYFLGEAELVAYARKMKIFGPENVMPMETFAANGRAYGKRRARSSSSVRTSQTIADVNNEGSDSDNIRQHKRHRRRSNKNKVGSSAHNPIALSSDSSGDDTSNENAQVSIDSVEEDESYEEEEESDEDSTFSTSSEQDDESGNELLDSVTSSQRSAKPRGKFRSHTQESSTTKANARENVKAKPEMKPKPTSDGTSVDSDEEILNLNHNKPRPLLTTTHKKRIVSKSSQPHPDQTAKGVTGSGKHHNQKRGVKSVPTKRKALRTIIGRKSKSIPRSLLGNHAGEQEDNDNSFDLGVAEYGESPPRRPPSRAHSRANSVMSSPAASAGAASPSSEEQKQKVSSAPGPRSSPAASFTPHSILPSSTKTPSTPTTPSVRAKSNADDANTSAQVSMELTQVMLFPDRDNKYHIRVTVSGDKPPVHTVWMENLSSHEQREFRFLDVSELPDARTDIHVPTGTVLTALFRCLSSQPDAVVIVGPETRATAESKTAPEKGKVQLRMSTAEKQSGEPDGSGDGLTLVVTYPALDLFWVDHNFPMKVVSSDQQHHRLTQEIKQLQEQLALAKTGQDKLREQLLQKEEMLHQAEAQVKSERQCKEKIQRRMADLVEKKTQILTQAQEKEKRDKDRARRWVFAQSDWMSAFQPCRALIAGIAADTGRSFLRPALSTASRKYVVEWKEVVEIAEPFFQPTTPSEGGLTRSITVVKDGVYQVNANVSHDSLVEMQLVITPTNEAAATRRATQKITPTKVSLYDNKRRVSRVDLKLELRAMDQLSLELLLLGSGTLPSGQEWLRTPMPTHNRLLIVILDEHAVLA